MENKTFFTVKEVAEIFNVNAAAVYLWINTGTIGFHKFRGRYRISDEDVRKFEKRSHNRAHQERAF